MYLITISELQNLVNHFERSMPLEGAGIILSKKLGYNNILAFKGTTSLENTSRSFRIRDTSIREIKNSIAGTGMRICGCFHSHVIGPSRPSYFDMLCPKNEGDLWLIYSMNDSDFNIFVWNGTSFRPERFRIIT